jgi:ATP-dependent Zn protease
VQDKIMMGAERKSMVQTAQCRRNTAYHEAGHALVALNTKGAVQGLGSRGFGRVWILLSGHNAEHT